MAYFSKGQGQETVIPLSDGLMLTYNHVYVRCTYTNSNPKFYQVLVKLALSVYIYLYNLMGPIFEF